LFTISYKYKSQIILVYYFSYYIFIHLFTVLGLFGDNGILPAKNTLINESPKLFDKFNAKPTLLWFSSELSLNTEYMFDLICLLGIFFSFLG